MLDLLAGLTETGYNAAPISGRANKPGVTRKWPLLNRALFGAEFAPICAILARPPKNPEKTARKVLENGAEWRFFDGIERHFAARGADVARSLPASLPELTSFAVWLRTHPPARGIGDRAPFSCPL
jgi:hypothetical protein